MAVFKSGIRYVEMEMTPEGIPSRYKSGPKKGQIKVNPSKDVMPMCGEDVPVDDKIFKKYMPVKRGEHVKKLAKQHNSLSGVEE